MYKPTDEQESCNQGSDLYALINSIDEGYDEIFSGSGKPPLFTNDEVQFFNQFMKININKIK